MQLKDECISVSKDALLEALGQGLFNFPDKAQILALVELDALNQYPTCLNVAREKPGRAADILRVLCEQHEMMLAWELYDVLKQDPKIPIAKLEYHLSHRRSEKETGSQDVKSLLEQMAPVTECSREIHFDVFMAALKDTVHNYHEAKVGRNLMKAYFHMDVSDREQVMVQLTAEEIYHLTHYLDRLDQYQSFLLEIPLDKLSGVVHEMRERERRKVLHFFLMDRRLDQEHFSKALSGVYRVSDSGTFHDPHSISERGRLLNKIIDKHLALDKIFPDKLAMAIQIMDADEEINAMARIFKQKKLTREHIYAIDQQLKAQTESPGSGLKRLIERIHDHEGLFSLSTTTSRAYPIILELRRLKIADFLETCLDAE